MASGRLTAVYGPMFSGKTTYLIEHFGLPVSTIVFKPKLDTRYTKRSVVISHTQQEIPAILINHRKPGEMLSYARDFKRVMIDEVNLFSIALFETVIQLLRQGKEVWVAGLCLDSERHDWPPMTDFIFMADEKVEVFARCDGDWGKCRIPATLSYRKVPKTELVKIGGVDEYGACCLTHYPELHHPPTTW
jgi:thymidine kinase